MALFDMSTITPPRSLCSVCPSGQGRRGCRGQEEQYQGWWTGRSRGTGYTLREPETSNTSLGHECKAKAEKCCPFAPGDLLDSISALKNSTHSPAAVMAGHSGYQKHPDVSQHCHCSCQLTAHCRTASHTSLFWPGPACCCELFCIPGFRRFLQGGSYSPAPPLHPSQGCQCCSSVTGPGVSGGLISLPGTPHKALPGMGTPVAPTR